MTEDLTYPDDLYNLTLPVEPLKLQAMIDYNNTGELPEEMDLPEAFRYWLVARAFGLIKHEVDKIIGEEDE